MRSFYPPIYPTDPNYKINSQRQSKHPSKFFSFFFPFATFFLFFPWEIRNRNIINPFSCLSTHNLAFSKEPKGENIAIVKFKRFSEARS